MRSCRRIDIISHLLWSITCDTNQAKCSRMGNYFMALAPILDIFHWISLFVWRGFRRTLVTGQHVGSVGDIWGFWDCSQCKNLRTSPGWKQEIVVCLTTIFQHNGFKNRCDAASCFFGISLHTEIQHGLGFGEETHGLFDYIFFTRSCKFLQTL